MLYFFIQFFNDLLVFLQFQPFFFFYCFQIVFLFDQHQQETEDQKPAGDPDGAVGKVARETTAAGGADGKGADSSEIDRSNLQLIFFPFSDSSIKMIHAASQVADTHGAGIGTASYGAERLYLHGTGKGCKSVCKPV